jgi:hypothetical protein
LIAGRRPRESANVIYIRPRLASTGTLWSRSSTLTDAVVHGSRAVTDDLLATILGWRMSPLSETAG